MSRRVGVEAAVPVARAVAWGPLSAGALMGLALIAYLRVNDAGLSPRVAGLRVGSILLAAGAAFALDDPAASTLASSPTPFGARRSVRVVLAAGACLAVWTSMLGLAGAEVGPYDAGLTLEAAGMLCVALGTAAVAQGAAAGPTLVFLLLSAWMVDVVFPRWQTLLLVQPGDPVWDAAHLRWVALAAAGLILVVWTARDPARRWRPA